MNSIPLRFYHELVSRLNQMTIQGNRHKMAVYINLNPEQSSANDPCISSSVDNTLLVFHIMFERNNADSPWRLITPLRFTD